MEEKYVSLNGYSPAVWWRWSSSVIHASSGSATSRQVHMIIVVETTKCTTSWCSQSKRLLEWIRKRSLCARLITTAATNYRTARLWPTRSLVVELVHPMSWSSHRPRHHITCLVNVILITLQMTKSADPEIFWGGWLQHYTIAGLWKFCSQIGYWGYCFVAKFYYQ